MKTLRSGTVPRVKKAGEKKPYLQEGDNCPTLASFVRSVPTLFLLNHSHVLGRNRSFYHFLYLPSFPSCIWGVGSNYGAKNEGLHQQIQQTSNEIVRMIEHKTSQLTCTCIWSFPIPGGSPKSKSWMTISQCLEPTMVTTVDPP